MVQSDNRTVVAYIKNQGGTRSLILLDSTRELLLLAHRLRIDLLPFYIPGQYNTLADSLSRGKDLPDWHLSDEITAVIFQRMGTPVIGSTALRSSLGDFSNGRTTVEKRVLERRPEEPVGRSTVSNLEPGPALDRSVDQSAPSGNERLGVQLSEWLPNPSEQYLSRFKAIHSSRWDLSCEVKKQRCKKYRTWQEMYSWKSWRNLEVFTIEGGEAVLWTDLVDTGNLDYHLWPRAAAVAERLWSDVVANGTVTSHVYVRLDSQRWRMVLKSIQVQPIWPLYCSFSPGVCLEKIKSK
ncbi:hypothetical protein PYW08_010496 [Mythimna loreyi]|uniref:Uncharacterized protein n=1 Tax=Mythimna loreyi TaxID=667449 RepID=A0ACC2Q9T3_9NEOP|nr:hypothetical protein PYW08_010496 [Mythimna loreyi]